MKKARCEKYTIDDICLGQSASFKVTITDKLINNFAALTGDYSPLHTNKEFARRTQFRERIAHGLLASSYVSTLVGMYLPGENATIQNHSARYLTPVKANDTLTIKGEVTKKEALLGKITLEVKISNQNNENVVEGAVDVIVNAPPGKGITMKDLKKNSMKLDLKGKVALITGASRGIGAATAKLFAEHGADVVVNYNLGKKDAESVVSDIRGAKRNAIAVKADVTKKSDVDAMIAAAVKKFKKIDILINNAMSNAIPAEFEKIRWEQMQQDIDVAVKGAFNCVQATLPVMLKNKYGKVVNITTIYSNSAPPPGFTKYVTAKTALLGLTRALAIEYASKNIFFNVVSPGFTETDLGAHIPDWLKKKMALDVPLKRNAQPLDVAKTILVMASPYTDYVVGNQMLVCGGSVML